MVMIIEELPNYLGFNMVDQIELKILCTLKYMIKDTQ